MRSVPAVCGHARSSDVGVSTRIFICVSAGTAHVLHRHTTVLRKSQSARRQNADTHAYIHTGSPGTNATTTRYIHSGSPGNSFQPVHTRSCFSWLALSVALGRAEATTACTWLGLGLGLGLRLGLGFGFGFGLDRGLHLRPRHGAPREEPRYYDGGGARLGLVLVLAYDEHAAVARVECRVDRVERLEIDK